MRAGRIAVERGGGGGESRTRVREHRQKGYYMLFPQLFFARRRPHGQGMRPLATNKSREALSVANGLRQPTM